MDTPIIMDKILSYAYDYMLTLWDNAILETPEMAELKQQLKHLALLRNEYRDFANCNPTEAYEIYTNHMLNRKLALDYSDLLMLNDSDYVFDLPMLMILDYAFEQILTLKKEKVYRDTNMVNHQLNYLAKLRQCKPFAKADLIEICIVYEKYRKTH